MSKILTREAFENAIRANAAIGGSTNAVIHLLAHRRPLGVTLELDDFDRLGADLPCLVDLQPSGQYLMEDFCYAGGLPAVLRELGARLLHRDALTVNGKSIWDNVKDAPCWDLDAGFGNHKRSSGRSRTRSRRTPGSRCCAATSRPTAP